MASGFKSAQFPLGLGTPKRQVGFIGPIPLVRLGVNTTGSKSRGYDYFHDRSAFIRRDDEEVLLLINLFMQTRG